MSDNSSVMRIGVIGAGLRACVANSVLSLSDRLHMTKIYDPDADACRKWIKQSNSANCVICSSEEEIFADPEISWVMVFSPNSLHCEHILKAFAAGKNVFAEKPLATSIEDCRKICDAAKASGKSFCTGFVLRCAPIYREVKRLLDEGVIGRIISIEANEHITPFHGAHIMSCWRRFKEISGSHMLEKCCHDLDLIHWFTNSLPVRVASFGGLNLFTPENAYLKEKFIDPETGTGYFNCDERHEPNAFLTEKTIIDNQVAIMEFANGVRVSFTANNSNVIPERRMFFSGSEGTLIVDMVSGKIQVRRLGEPCVRDYTFRQINHAGGDAVLAQELQDTMLNEKPFVSSGLEGLNSAVAALGIEEARVSGRIVDLTEVWNALGTELNSPAEV